MTDTNTSKKNDSEWWDLTKFLIKLFAFFLILRCFIVSPFFIPSESMLPRLMVGDYLLVAKWPYGYSKYSLPFNAPLIPGRVFASQPEAGDVAVFKAPPGNHQDYIKRVIGVPGDIIQMRDGQLYINDKPIAKEPVADMVVKQSPNTTCLSARFEAVNDKGEAICRYPQFKETLPNGVSYHVLDTGISPVDDTDSYVVPEGMLFLMGDNRDHSADSRFPAMEGQGIGFVPQENMVGRALISVFSTDGSARFYLPWTWFTAARWERIGERF